MRIITGSKKGTHLYGPETINIRPTTDRAKESLFNIIGTDIYDSSFLDLFSGSGAIALEAKSRNAKSVTAVDNSRESQELIKKNIDKTGLIVDFMLSDVKNYLKSTNEKFDIIFMDPPFTINDEQIMELINIILDNDLLLEDGKLIIEREYKKENEKTYADFKNLNIRKYGKVSFIFIG